MPELQLQGIASTKHVPSLESTVGGAEACLHFVDGMAIKIFREENTEVDPPVRVREKRFNEDDIEGKIAELQKLSNPYLVLPRGIVTDAFTGEKLGYWMDQ